MSLWAVLTPEAGFMLIAQAECISVSSMLPVLIPEIPEIFLPYISKRSEEASAVNDPEIF